MPVPVTVPDPLTVTVRVGLNVAVTLWAMSMVNVHVVALPEQSPPQPKNVHPAAGDAVSVTKVPLAKLAEHVPPLPQAAMPAGDESTLPPPDAGPGVTGSKRGPEVNVAVTACAAVIVTTHEPVPEHAPLQPLNVSPEPGVAVSVTTVL